MTHEEKTIKYEARNTREAFRTKTPLDELPLRLEFGSSSHHPDRKGGMTTCDIVLWVKFCNSDWFRPYGNFSHPQIISFIEICNNDQQIDSLISMLSCVRV